jgi:hypothetical protein
MTPATLSASTSTLASRAMIVSVTISQWSGRRLDRQVTQELNDSHNAASDASRVNKLLVSKEALAGIQTLVSETRNGFYERTLPWLNDGGRIISADGYLPFTAWMRVQSAKFQREVDKLVNHFDQHVTDAQKRMGKLFKAADYPTSNEIREKFGIVYSVLPVPSSADFRVDMSEAHAALIRADIEEQLQKATENAVRDVYQRIATLTERMVDRLNSFTPGERTGGFRSSLVENIADLISVMPSLNIVGSPELDALGRRLKALTKYDAAALKEDAAIRKDTAAEAQRILDSVSDFLA